MKALFLPLSIGLLAAPALVHAASEDAWEVFRASVEATCRNLIDPPEAADISIEVNPFGSESYGAALVTVDFGEAGQDRQVCIYDKRAETAELTAAFTPEGEAPLQPTVRGADRPVAKP